MSVSKEGKEMSQDNDGLSHRILKAFETENEIHKNIRTVSEEVRRQEVVVEECVEDGDIAREKLDSAQEAAKTCGEKYVKGAVDMGFLSREAAEERLDSLRKSCSASLSASSSPPVVSSDSVSLPPVLAEYAGQVRVVVQKERLVGRSEANVRDAKAKLAMLRTTLNQTRRQCRHIAESIETLQEEALSPLFESAKSPDKFSLREACRSVGGIPTSMRQQIWPVLLGLDVQSSSNAKQLDAQARDIEKTDGTKLKTYRIIEMDVERTRQTMPFFRRTDVKDLMKKMLAHFCLRRGLEYTQGLHELMAAFLWLYRGHEEGRVPTTSGGGDDSEDDDSRRRRRLNATAFNVFYSFLNNFLPTMFKGEDFSLLNASLRFFELLLQYHCPKLSTLLLQYGLKAQLYATSWFVTLFSNMLPLDNLFHVWSIYVIEGSPFVHHFVSLALLESQSRSLNAAEAETDGRVEISRDLLMEQLMMNKDEAQQHGFGHIRMLTRRARSLLAATPKSFYQMLQHVCYRLDGSLPDATLVKGLEAMLCLEVKPQELLQAERRRQQEHTSSGDIRHAASLSPRLGDTLKYFVFDCRSQKEYDRAHFSLSFHLDPSLLTAEDASKFDDVLKRFEALRGSAGLCFMDRGSSAMMDARKLLGLGGGDGSSISSTVSLPPYSSSIATRFALFFIQRGYERVALVPGGFAACKIALRNSPQLSTLLIGNDAAPRDSSSDAGVLSGVMSRLLSRASHAIIASVSDESALRPPPAPTLTLVGGDSDDGEKDDSPAMLLVKFDGVDNSDAFGVEYRVVEQSLSATAAGGVPSATVAQNSWCRANADRAVPSTGARDVPCMYMLGSRVDESLARTSGYQVRIAVHCTPRVGTEDTDPRGRCAAGWSAWSEASRVVRISSTSSSSLDVGTTGLATKCCSDSCIYPALPDERTVVFREKRSLGMVLRGVRPPLDGARMRIFVVKVEDGSAAAAMNVTEGAELLAVGGLPVGPEPCDDLNGVIDIIKRFCSGTGEKTSQLAIRFRRSSESERAQIARKKKTPSTLSMTTSHSGTSPTSSAADNVGSRVERGAKRAMRAIFGGGTGGEKNGEEGGKSNSGVKRRVGNWLKRRISGEKKKQQNATVSECGVPEAMGLVPFAQWRRIEAQDSKEGAKFFKATQIVQESSKATTDKVASRLPCWITVSNRTFVSLQESAAHPGWASVTEKFPLENLVKVTSKKSVKNLIVFHVKEYASRVQKGPERSAAVTAMGNTARLFYVVDEKKQCVAWIKEKYREAP